MLTEKQLQAYAELVVTQGVNLQPNQDLMITCPPECVNFARALAKEAYRKGAFRVSINYQDDVLTRIRLDEAQDASMEDVLPWVTDMRNNLVDRGGAHIPFPPKTRTFSAGQTFPNCSAFPEPIKWRPKDILKRLPPTKFAGA